jgi:hypothetical protein
MRPSAHDPLAVARDVQQTLYRTRPDDTFLTMPGSRVDVAARDRPR